MNKDFNINTELAKMAEITSKTGEIYDLQAMQVQLWGFVAFDYLGKGGWKAKIDAESQSVTYELAKKVKYPKDMANRLYMLEMSVQALFQTFSSEKAWKLKVIHKSTVLYETVAKNG